MSLQWMFLLLLIPLLAAQNRRNTSPNNSGKPLGKGKQWSLLCPQEKVLLSSFCRAAVQLMARRIQQLYQRRLMSTLGPKSTSWVVVRQSSVRGWRAPKLGVLGKCLQSVVILHGAGNARCPSVLAQCQGAMSSPQRR